ncbi:MAG: hypothetical protein ORN58_02795, partial [Sediminibacterium sp.]|nr:hypothetical protein [Sediminibacterium sp.]
NIGVWNHYALTVNNGNNLKLYMNGVLIFSGTNIGTPVSTYTTNYLARQNDGSQAPTIGSYREFRIWRKERTVSEIQSTYRVSVLPNSDSLYYYLPLDEKLYTTKNIPNNTILANKASTVGALMATSTIISQNNGTGAKYFVDSNYQRLNGTYTDTLNIGEMIQVSYDLGLTWRTVKFALNNNWYDSLTSTFSGGVIKIRSVKNGEPTNRTFADFKQFFKPTAPIIGIAIPNERGKVLVNFALPVKTGGGIINYTVQSKPGNITSSGLVSPIQVTGLTNGTSYTFKVVANSEVGVSDTSGSSNIVVPVIDTTFYFSNSYFQTTTKGANASLSDYISLPTFTLGNNFTIETWFKLNEFTDPNYPRIFDFGIGGNYKTLLFLNPSRQLQLIYGNIPTGVSISPAVTVNIGVWNHYALTVNNGNNLKLYMNGVLIFSGTNIGTPVSTYTTNY